MNKTIRTLRLRPRLAVLEIAFLLVNAVALASCSVPTPTPAPTPIPSPAPAASAAESASAALPLTISVAEAGAKRDEGAYILDVREQDEWNEVHIPDATLIPLGTLAERVNEVPKDREIVVVCRSGNRSQKGRDILLNAGFTSVTSMDGGMNEWRAQGLPTVTGP